MACGHDDTAANTKVRSREINLLCSAQTNVLHRHPLLAQSINQRCFDALAGKTDIVAHHDSPWVNHLGISLPNLTCDGLVQLIGDATPHVISLKAVKCVGHVSFARNDAQKRIVSLQQNRAPDHNQSGCPQIHRPTPCPR